MLNLMFHPLYHRLVFHWVDAYECFSCLLSIAVIETMTKNKGGKALFQLTGSESITEAGQGRSSKQVLEAKSKQHGRQGVLLTG